MSEQENDAIVRRFIAEWSAEHADVATLLEYFTDDPVYHNMPGPPAEGREAVEAALQSVAALNSRGWEIVHQAAIGDVVLNERIDRWDAGGKTVELPLCGVFELRDGKIAVWRDYFDMATFTRIMS